jgi:colicin import membrane protein
MNEATYRTIRDEDLKKSLIYSLGVHVAVVLFFTVKMVFFPGEEINYQAAVKVDLVALPDKIDLNTPPPPSAKETKAPEAKAPPKPEPKVKEKEVVKEEHTVSLKKKEQDALKKLKAMEALEKIKQEASKEKPTAAASTKQEGEHKYKGNIISPGTELTGLNKLQHEEYIANLDRHIKQHWTLPEWLAKKNYTAQVRVKFNDNGIVTSKQLVKSSGNSTYDDIVMSTIDKASPFPVPPEKFSAIVSVNGILIGFPE